MSKINVVVQRTVTETKTVTIERPLVTKNLQGRWKKICDEASDKACSATKGWVGRKVSYGVVSTNRT